MNNIVRCLKATTLAARGLRVFMYRSDYLYIPYKRLLFNGYNDTKVLVLTTFLRYCTVFY